MRMTKTRTMRPFFLAFACLLKVATCYEAQFATAHRYLGEPAYRLSREADMLHAAKFVANRSFTPGRVPLLAVADRYPPSVGLDLMQLSTF